MYKSRLFFSAISDCRRFFLNARIMTAGMLLVFIYTFAIRELLNCADKAGIPLNAAESFIAVGSSGLLIMFIPSVFLILASDFPKMGKHTIFVVTRTGRLPWVISKIISALASVVIYVGVIFLFCFVATLQNGTVSTEWSDTVTKYASMFPEEDSSLIIDYLAPNLYNHFTLGEALLHTAALLVLYLFLLGMILLFFRIKGLKTAGIAVDFGVIACGVVTCSLKIDAMWLFPMAHTVPLLHYEEAFRKPIMPIFASYLYFGVLIAVSVGANLIAAKKMNYSILEEE